MEAETTQITNCSSWQQASGAVAWSHISTRQPSVKGSVPHHELKSPSHRITEWFGLEGTLKIISFHPPAIGRDPFHQTRVLRAPSSLALNPDREGAATASLGSLGHGLTSLTVKNFFIISHLNLPSFSLKPSPLVLSPHALAQPLSSSLADPPGTGSCSKVSPQPSLPQAEQPQLSQPVLPAEGFQPSDHGWGLLWPCSHSSRSVLC